MNMKRQSNRFLSLCTFLLLLLAQSAFAGVVLDDKEPLFSLKSGQTLVFGKSFVMECEKFQNVQNRGLYQARGGSGLFSFAVVLASSKRCKVEPNLIDEYVFIPNDRLRVVSVDFQKNQTSLGLQRIETNETFSLYIGKGTEDNLHNVQMGDVREKFDWAFWIEN